MPFYCFRCGAENPDESNFCMQCGGTFTADLKARTEGVKRTSGLAIAALVCGIVGLPFIFPIACIPGIVLGIMAIKQINHDPSLDGRTMAVIGLICSIVSAVMLALLALFFLCMPLLIKA